MCCSSFQDRATQLSCCQKKKQAPFKKKDDLATYFCSIALIKKIDVLLEQKNRYGTNNVENRVCERLKRFHSSTMQEYPLGNTP